MRHLDKSTAAIALLLGLCSAGWLAAHAPTAPSASRPATGPTPGLTVRWVAHEIDYTRTDAERLEAVVRFQPDPALRLAYVDRLFAAEHAEDDRGRSLVLPGGVPTARGGWKGRACQWSNAPAVDEQLIILLQAPPVAADAPRSTHIRFIEGTIPAAVIVKTDRIEMPVPGEASREYANDVQVKFVAKMTKPTECELQYSIKMSESPPGGYWLWMGQTHLPGARVVDAKGQPWEAGQGGGSGGPRALDGAKNFRAPDGKTDGSPLKAVIDLITETKETTIPFRLENIPLP
jgi:hypothetical protein